MNSTVFFPSPTASSMVIALDQVRAAYYDAVSKAVATGRGMPLLIPYSLLGTLIVPALWLAVPHLHRPVLYQTRWLVVAFCLAFNTHVIVTSSSDSYAISYVIGLVAAWGIMSTMHLLVWSRPQFDALRAVKASKLSQPAPADVKHSKPAPLSDTFYWQPFPADAPFLDRLGWAVDLISSFRGIGWNWSTTSVPRPRAPRANEPVDMDSMPLVAKCGSERCTTEAEFVRKRLSSIAILYFIVDLCLVIAARDPYFLLGPDHAFELPGHLRNTPDYLLLAYRQLVTVTLALCALNFLFSINDLLQYWYIKAYVPSRSALWLHPSSFGDFTSVLDRGLSGFWGGFWHQMFRQQFLAPATYLIENGYIKKGSQTAINVMTLISFFQSGFFHLAGSLASIPETKLWRPVLFFLLQALGMLIQSTFSGQARRFLPTLHKAVAKAANLLFTIGWLYCTATFLIDDFTSAGLAMTELLPVSPLRWLGLGRATDSWLRWDRNVFPKWYRGQHWWESGLAL
ncbi:hypothetical protein XA68_12025 [Ophiocordyceps unilateralis]|uniref:Wax synthase domain-containing protein n=1 Tax=Ophiocordyceps unilateralis TaxID=268505 RepID=A0A2A9PFK2_OPHUN|nr:hypothetical protein XA68_12025 [Ophiocordyceps unilateralis]